MLADTNQQKLSPEELQKLQDIQLEFMSNQIPNLKIQEEYTRLKAEIAENVFNEHFNKVKLAQLKNPNPKGSDFDIDKNEE